MRADGADAAGVLAAERGGHVLWLLPQRALWWPQRRWLMVADVHLGKAHAFRRQGVPVPEGTTAGTLERLDALLAAWPAERLVVLGDFLHSAHAQTPTVLDAVHAWRARHAGLDVTLVRGNHDDRAGDPPASLGIAVVDEPWSLGPFAACHHPRDDGLLHAEVEAASASFVLAGHTHPVCRLQGRGRDTMRLPCFVRSAGQLVLPAFGTFTGGYLMDPAPGVQRYPVGGGQVWCLPADGS